MDRVSILCSKDEVIMLEFSKCSLERLREYPSFNILFTPCRSFINRNVLKEIEKDCLIIEYASAIAQSGDHFDDGDIHSIFEKTKDIDRDFLADIAPLPLKVKISYDDIMHVRMERIRLIAKTVFDFLSQWDNSYTFVDLIKERFSARRVQEIIFKMLHLYSLETKMLSTSFRFLPPFSIAQEKLADSLFAIMEKTAEDISCKYARKLFSNRDLPCENRK